jgi:hypothetical protein
MQFGGEFLLDIFPFPGKLKKSLKVTGRAAKLLFLCNPFLEALSRAQYTLTFFGIVPKVRRGGLFL